jgi:predicted TIM-barrel fold metal-dependent hydrolase
MITHMSKKFVDSHFHVFDAGDGLPSARYRPHYDAPMRAWKESSCPVGIQRGVLVQTSFMGTDNQRLLNELAGDPTNLRGVVVVAPDVDTTQFSQWHAAGVRGIRLNLAGGSHAVESWRKADRIWRAMHELGWHLVVHTDPGQLPKVLTQIPAAIPLVLDHMAKPASAQASDPTFQAVAQRASKSAVHVKLSGAYRLEGRVPEQLAQLWLQVLGAESLLWGSDWPCTQHESEAVFANLFNQLESWVGSDLIDQILLHNPEQLYWRT